METPRKVQGRYCIVCATTGSAKTEWRDICSDSGRKKELQKRLVTYGGINISSGYICRSCERRLLNLHKNVEEFRRQCQETLSSLNVKRCIPVTPTNKENFGGNPKRNPNSDDSEILDVSVNSSSEHVFLSPSVPSTDDISESLGVVPISPLTPSNVQNVPFRSIIISPLTSTRAVNTPFRSILPKPRTTAVEQEEVVPNVFKKPNGKSDSVTPDDHRYVKQDPKKVRRKLDKTPQDSDCQENIVAGPHKFSDECILNEDRDSVQDALKTTSSNALAQSIVRSKNLKKHVIHEVLEELRKENPLLKNRKRGKLSVLMSKSYNDLHTFNWNSVVEELKSEFPLLFEVFVAFMLPNYRQKPDALNPLLPRLGLVYAILAQGRNIELSRVQQISSVLLFDNLCDQKVFDRLQPLGMCMSYGHSLRILDKLSGHFKDEIVSALKDGKKIRLVGDNINWFSNVHDQRQDRHGHFNHAFGSAVIVQNVSFDHLSPVKPQCLLEELTVEKLLPTKAEWDIVKEEYGMIMAQVVSRLVPYLKFIKDVVPKVVEGPYTNQMNRKNKVIPLPVLHLNEQKYEDVVQIMDYYEELLDECYTEAGVEKEPVHIGGDQLTRERFSGAKRLRTAGLTAEERFDHLTPITFELFHLLMNFVSLIFKQLYKADSIADIGTMRCEQNRILRTNVNENVNDHYDSDKDFISSFVDAHIVEATLEYFGMADVNSPPTKNEPPASWDSPQQKASWVKEVFGQIVKQFLWQKLASSDETVIEDGHVIHMKLADGQMKTIILRKSPQKKNEDFVKNYAHLVLELGLFFKSMLGLCKVPDRDRGIRLFKIAVIYFKANNYLSTYAYELVRMLVQQLYLLSEQEAHEQFYGLFVNTKNRLDSHIPADLQMEFIVKLVKKHIKHMFSNKTEQNISKRTAAIPGVTEISENFDETTKVNVRCKKHSDVDAERDELDMVNDLRQLRPFRHVDGRAHVSFPSIHENMESLLDADHFHSWISYKKFQFATEIGQ